MEEVKQPDLETPEVLDKKELAFLQRAGDHQFKKAWIEAELLQMNQEILRIRNKRVELQAASEKAAAAANKAEPAIKIAPPAEVIPA